MAATSAQSHEIAFTLGARRIAGVRRRLVPLAFSLEQAMAGQLPPLPDAAGVDGVRVLSVPVSLIAAVRAAYPAMLKGAEQHYRRGYVALNGTYEDYLARFSGKTRSTLRRKLRKFEEASGGTLDFRAYRSPGEITEFLDLARPLAAATYQARLLDAALPGDAAFRKEALALAARGSVRAFLLFLDGAPAAYLYLPAEGETLLYAFLGHDPARAALSPGTVLQMAALERIFAERRFRYFDFTEGEGAHKALFATDFIECASFVLLRPTFANRLLFAALATVDRAAAGAKRLARATGVETALRKLLRR